MVGETGILASISRSIAARLRGVRYFEAPIPRAMLEADLTGASFEPEPERMSPVPSSPGFGAEVLADRLERYTVGMRAAALEL
jgi:hypothetical protein